MLAGKGVAGMLAGRGAQQEGVLAGRGTMTLARSEEVALLRTDGGRLVAMVVCRVVWRASRIFCVFFLDIVVFGGFF